MMENIPNAVTVARIVKNNLNNSFIKSPYSTYLALRNGLDQQDLTTKERINEWISLKQKVSGKNPSKREEILQNLDKDSGTVGAVAVDKNGNLCAATSTGGRLYQVPGRIGDSPLPGCGFYCNENIAISVTGVGESIIKSQLSHRVAFNYSKDISLKESVESSLDYLEDKTDGYAGVIAVNKDGDYYVSYNSPEMTYSIKD